MQFFPRYLHNNMAVNSLNQKQKMYEYEAIPFETAHSIEKQHLGCKLLHKMLYLLATKESHYHLKCQNQTYHTKIQFYLVILLALSYDHLCQQKQKTKNYRQFLLQGKHQNLHYPNKALSQLLPRYLQNLKENVLRFFSIAPPQRYRGIFCASGFINTTNRMTII